jgi:hypothetical protein
VGAEEWKDALVANGVEAEHVWNTGRETRGVRSRDGRAIIVRKESITYLRSLSTVPGREMKFRAFVIAVGICRKRAGTRRTTNKGRFSRISIISFSKAKTSILYYLI